MTATLAMTSRTFPPRLADLGFTMDVPEGFIAPEMPTEDVDFSDPTMSAPIAVLSSQVALAVIAVAARPAYEDGTVLAWLRYLSAHFKIDLQHVQIRGVGKDAIHLGITAFGVQYQDGAKLNLMIVAFEDGGRFITAHAMCPAELWPSYGAALSAAVESITLTNPKGSTHAVDDYEARQAAAQNSHDTAAAQIEASQLSTHEYIATLGERSKPHSKGHAKSDPMQAAIAAAREHLAADAFEEAEQAIQKVDRDIQGSVKISMLYKEHLTALVQSGVTTTDKARIERVFFRALSWAQSCYPEPHTECEAENYEAGRIEDRAELVALLGYDPDKSPSR